MYTKDKNNRITLRLNDTQFEFVTKAAESMGLSPSEFLRTVITIARGEYERNQKGQDNGRENDKAHFDNLV